MRRMFRAVQAPDAPDRYRGSWFGWWWYCAERSRHYVHKMVPKKPITKQIRAGRELDEILRSTLGKRWPWENRFLDELQKLQDPYIGFTRELDYHGKTVTISGHPDDYQVSLDGAVSLLEEKTTEIPSLRMIERYLVPKAEQQDSVYCWIFDPLLSQIGYHVAKTHSVLYWKVDHKADTCELIDTYPFDYHPDMVEKMIIRCLDGWNDPAKIIPPKCRLYEQDVEEWRKKSWKCRSCPKIHKAVCQFWQ